MAPLYTPGPRLCRLVKGMRDLTADTLCRSLTAMSSWSNKPKPCQVQVTSVLPATNSSQAKITYGDTSRRVTHVEDPSRREVDISSQILPSLR